MLALGLGGPGGGCASAGPRVPSAPAGGESPDTPAADEWDTGPRAEPARFTLRGRWDEPTDISWRAEDGGPVDRDAWLAALRVAHTTWSREGTVAFREAAPGEAADVTYGWREGAHDECPPFGGSMATAHTGPVGPGTFVHFDAGRPWGGADGESLPRAAVHEVGHVLGLGHSPDPGSIMHPDAHVDGPTRSDRAGLATLYGHAAPPGPADLVVGSDDGPPRAVLVGLAPPGITGFEVFDTDGDGDDEVLVWNADPAGAGALTIVHFDARGRPESTRGPLVQVVPAGTRPQFLVDADGRRWMVTHPAGLPTQLRLFDGTGLFTAHSPLDRRGLQLPGPPASPDGPAVVQGDVDGDGETESVSRPSPTTSADAD